VLTALIIDDVAQARATLKQDVADYCPEIDLLGEADGVVSGAKLIREKKPQLVFLDIQMQDGSGFDLLEILGDSAPKIIFTTASDAFAIKAFRFSAIDYLLKPIDPDELMAAVNKVGENPANDSGSMALLKDSISSKKAPQRLALNTLDKIHITEIKEIIRCESQGNYTEFFFTSGKKLLVTKTLKEFDKILSEQGFLRVHQSHLINKEQVKEFVKTDGGYLIMKDGDDVPVSSRKRASVLEAIADF